jgi:hypothetical protein
MAESAPSERQLTGIINSDDRFRAPSSGGYPERPTAVFSVNDWSTLELDLRRHRLAKPRRRQRSFAEAGRRSSQFRGEQLPPANTNWRYRPVEAIVARLMSQEVV